VLFPMPIPADLEQLYRLISIFLCPMSWDAKHASLSSALSKEQSRSAALQFRQLQRVKERAQLLFLFRR
jgi:hypothetical protein